MSLGIRSSDDALCDPILVHAVTRLLFVRASVLTASLRKFLLFVCIAKSLLVCRVNCLRCGLIRLHAASLRTIISDVYCLHHVHFAIRHITAGAVRHVGAARFTSGMRACSSRRLTSRLHSLPRTRISRRPKGCSRSSTGGPRRILSAPATAGRASNSHRTCTTSYRRSPDCHHGSKISRRKIARHAVNASQSKSRERRAAVRQTAHRRCESRWVDVRLTRDGRRCCLLMFTTNAINSRRFTTSFYDRYNETASCVSCWRRAKRERCCCCCCCCRRRRRCC
jgi:hypothetical protein